MSSGVSQGHGLVAFISHSTRDDYYVQECVQLLRAQGYREVFNDGQSIAVDELFWPRIEQGIRDCDHFYVILSQDSVKSTWVDREAELARNVGKKVFGIRIDDCTLPSSFEGRDVLDLRPRRGEKRKIASSRIVRHAPKKLFGRDHWLDALDGAWKNPNLNVYVLVAWGGVGKTSLVVHWVSQRFEAHGWRDVERYFDWSFYSQGTGESRQTSSDLFIQEALTFFGDPEPKVGSAWERGERLAVLIRKYRTLLVLDGIEPLQHPPSDPQAGRLKDQALEALLQGLAADNPGLCVITTRERLKNIESKVTAEEQSLDQLAKEAGIDLLRHLQIVGTEQELEAAWRDSGGHALTLQLLGRFIADGYRDKHIRHYSQVNFEKADKESQGRTAFKVMFAYERWFESAGPDRQRELALLRLTGLFDRPMSYDCVNALRKWKSGSIFTHRFSKRRRQVARTFGPLFELSDTSFASALTRLSNVELLTLTPDAIDAHPLIREYFAKQLREKQPEAFQAAHSRLFDHLCKSTPYRPNGLEGLQPLYQAVMHGCLAGRQREARAKVYRDRILRGTGEDGFYSTRQLGAISADLAAVASFFDEPWSRLSPNLGERAQAWLFGVAAYRLRASGRLTEALQPERAGLGIFMQLGAWRDAATCAINLSALELKLGLLKDGLADARHSIRNADLSGDACQRTCARSAVADALHVSGERDEAGLHFAEAERLQMEHEPHFALLYSQQGFHYCDWIIVSAERAAWQVVLQERDSNAAMDSQCSNRHSETCDEVERRASLVFEWRRGKIWNPHADSLIDIAQDHLTLAKARLTRALLSDKLPQAALDLPDVGSAINGLRDAAQADYLSRGLLTAALYHFVRGDHDSARAALDEAQQIAERGPMPLYLADVHLHRARMFRDQAELGKARELIEKHGYWRRREELADATEAAEGWPG